MTIVFMFTMLMVTQKLMAAYPLTRTYSISPDSLHQIRAAADWLLENHQIIYYSVLE